jgi:hypothetical protein
MEEIMKKIYYVGMMLTMMTMSSTLTPVLANDPELAAGDTINISALGVEMKAAELHLSDKGYFVSKEGKLYGHSTTDKDASRPFTSDTKYGNYLHNVHDYISLLDNEVIKDIELSQNSRFVITESGKVLAGGYNNAGQLGTGSTSFDSDSKLEDVTSFFPNLGSSKIIKIAHTGFQTFALSNDGRVFGYGSNFILGDNVAMRYDSMLNGKVLTPIEITSFVVDYNRVNDPIVSISLGAALTESGVVYGWGNYFSSNLVPTSVFDQTLLNVGDYIVAVETIGNGIMVLSNEGRVFAIGSNQSYNLGFSNPSDTFSTFTELTVSGLNAGDKIVHMSYGFLISEQGSVFAWGDNTNGKTGIGNGNNSSLPLTDVTTSVSTHLQEDETYIYGFKTNNPNSSTASILITNTGKAVAYGHRYAFGYPNDGFNQPFYLGVVANPEKVTYTLNSLGGPDLGSYYWPKSYRVYYNNMLPGPFNSMASLLTVANYTFQGYFTDEALTNPLPTFDLTYATADMTIYVKWLSTGGSSSQGGSIPTSQPNSGDSQNPINPRPLGAAPIILGASVTAVGAGAIYWFVIQKKTLHELGQWFVILGGKLKKWFFVLMGKKKSDDKDDKQKPTKQTTSTKSKKKKS